MLNYKNIAKYGLLFGFCFVLLLRKTTFRTMRAKILNASAGSGKTYQLAYKYVRDVVERPTIYRHILAVTFTNKATEEMKTRILKEIHALASGKESTYLTRLCDELQLDAVTIRKRAVEARARILHDYSRFTVLTIDTFFQRILRAFIKELGIDLNYNVEIETASVLAKSTDLLIESISTDKELLKWLSEFVQERIDEGQKWDVRDTILTFGDELFKEENKSTLAAACSRKELERIVRMAATTVENLKQELQRVAAEAVRIIVEAGLSYTDFTNKSRSFARYFFTTAAGEFSAYSNTVGKMSRTTEGWCAKNSPAIPLVGQLQPLLAQICDLYDKYAAHQNTYQLLRENFRSFALLTDLYVKVQQLCAEQNLMLLSETKHILSKFIGQNDAPFIYEKVGNRFERFMIDEFQDTSTREWENFLPLLQNAMAQADDRENSVFIVGDIKQSIYRWRGGDWKILHDHARQALGTSQTEVVTLQDNFRSLPTIVEFNNRTIARLVALDNRVLNTLIDEAVAHGHLTQTDYEELHGVLAAAYQNHHQYARHQAEYSGYVSGTGNNDGGQNVAQNYTAAVDFLKKDNGIKNDVVLTRTAVNNERTQFYFDYAVNGVEVVMSDEMKQGMDMHSAIEVTVSRGSVTKYRRYMCVLEQTYGRQNLTGDFVSAVDNVYNTFDNNDVLVDDIDLVYKINGRQNNVPACWKVVIDGKIYWEAA